MKRSEALIALSREHHIALKTALNARKAAESGDLERIRGMAATVVSRMRSDFLPHFLVEERDVLPRLAAAGADALVQRTLDEHVALRTLVDELVYPDAETLEQFGVLLTAHVRFEERELFEACERLLAGRPVHEA